MRRRQPGCLLRLVLVSAALVVVLAALPQKGALAQGLGPTPGGLGVPGGESTAPEEQQPQPDDAVTQEDGEEGSGSSCSGTLGFVCSMVVNLLKGILDDVWNWFVEITEQAAQSLAGLAMGLPSLQEEDTLLSEYNKMVDAAKPFLLVCVLLLGVMMMVQSANYNTAYAWQYGLPKIGFAFLALTFFPDFVVMVSEVATGVGGRFAGENEAGGAIANILADTVLSGTAATLFTANPAIGALVAGILLLPTLAMIIFLLFASIVKNILFSILVITGPVAIVLYPVPGLSAVAGAWFRGVLACFLIPVLFSIEIAVGTMMINTPGLMIGTEATYVPVLGSILAVVMLWVMYKTPGKVIGWAFQGYGGGGGGLGDLMGGMIKHTSIRSLGKAIGGVAAGALGVAAGGGIGAAAAKAAASQRSISGQLGARIGEKAGRAALRFQYGKGGARSGGGGGYAPIGEAGPRGVRTDPASNPHDALRDLVAEDAARAHYAVGPDGVAEPLGMDPARDPNTSPDVRGGAGVAREGEEGAGEPAGRPGAVRSAHEEHTGAAQGSGSADPGSQGTGSPAQGYPGRDAAASGMTYEKARHIAAAESGSAYEQAYGEGLRFAENQAATYDARAAEFAALADRHSGGVDRLSGGTRVHYLEKKNKATQAAHGWRRNAHAYATEHAEKASAGVFERSIHDSAHRYAKDRATRAATAAYDHAQAGAHREAEVAMNNAAENRQLAKQHAADPAAAKRHWDLAKQHERRAEEMVSGLKAAAETAARQAWESTFDPAYKQIYGQEHRAIRGPAHTAMQDRTFARM